MIELNGKTHKEKDFIDYVLKALSENLEKHEQYSVIEQESKIFLAQGRRDKNQKYILAFKDITLKNAQNLKINIYNTMIDNENDLATKIVEQEQQIRKLKLKIRALEEQIRVYEGTQGEEEPISKNEEKQENTEKE